MTETRSRRDEAAVGVAILALVLGYGGLWLTDLPSLPFVVVIVVAGAGLAMLVGKRLDADE